MGASPSSGRPSSGRPSSPLPTIKNIETRQWSPPRKAPWEHSHTQNRSEENAIDPDVANSCMCSACTLPIFSTPFKIRRRRNKRYFLHDQCSNLPNVLTDHVFHPDNPLALKKNVDMLDSSSKITCDKCKQNCGSVFYQCESPSCKFKLDLLCSVQVKILHRSHEHRLTVVRGRASFVCGACGTQHHRTSTPSYMCRACGFWLHRDCASAPNAVKLSQHHHSLFLTYDLLAGYYSTPAGCFCAICGEKLLSLGAYICIKCGYYAHIRCATLDPRNSHPVLIRDAKLADLLHLPMADEGPSIVQYMLENTSVPAAEDDDGDEKEEEKDSDDGDGDEKEEKDTDDDDDGEDGDEDDKEVKEEADHTEKGHDRRLHKHPLILHDEDDGGDNSDDDDGTGHSYRVCNACVQFISLPFYSCSQCPDFHLHSSCTSLPSKIQHPFHQEHPLLLSKKAPKPKSDLTIGFKCKGCSFMCSGFAYSCKTCKDFSMDVLCALMPPSITHASHGKTHILYMSRNIGKCSCCNLHLEGNISYECSNCRHLKLHARCALLPSTINHSFDVHPLKLTTSTKISDINSDDDDSHNEYVDDNKDICEVCENDMDKNCWYYSCSHCEQLIHNNCIPFLDALSRIKFGVTDSFKIHKCPLTLVRESALMGYLCSNCEGKFRKEENGEEVRCSYECSKCCYRVHESCALSSNS